MSFTKSDHYSAPHLTKIPGCPDRSAIRPGMAFYCGSGPAGKTCGSCRHLDGNTRKKSKARCAMYKKLAGRTGEVIDPKFAACKYFEPRPQRPPIIAKHRPQISAAEAAILRTLRK